MKIYEFTLVSEPVESFMVVADNEKEALKELEAQYFDDMDERPEYKVVELDTEGSNVIVHIIGNQIC